MTMTVSGPGGITVDFPDGTDHDTISKVMAQATGMQAGPRQPGSALDEAMRPITSLPDNYRDVRQEFSVSIDGQAPVVTVTCKEAI